MCASTCLYAAFSDRDARAWSTPSASLVLGMSLCWVILMLGMAASRASINSPLLAFEVTQTGFGMYVKYFMAGFLGIFAVTMMIQFAGYFLEAVADARGDPGKRPDKPAGVAASRRRAEAAAMELFFLVLLIAADDRRAGLGLSGRLRAARLGHHHHRPGRS